MGLRDDIFITFGKYKGDAISEIPSSYLKWCLYEDFLEDNLIEVFEEELNWRTTWDQHFEDPADVRY